MSSAKDLTQGNPGSVLIRFTLPLFLSVFFQQLYSIADSAIAGKYVGEDALAAIGASYPITMLFMAVAIGSQIGCSVVLARLYGSKAYQRVHSCVSTAILSGFAISFLLSVGGVLASKWLMTLVETPENIFADGSLYLKIYTAGFVFVHLYNVITGLFSSLGDSKTPLYLLIFSSLGNIVLDLVFVLGLRQGVAGCAWATLIAQAAACVLSLIVLRKRMRVIPKNGAAAWFTWRDFRDIAVISIPSILQQSFISVGNLFVQRFVNAFGSSVIAGYSAAIKLNTFVLTCFTNMSSGMSSFTGQNLGAGEPERVRKGFRAGVLMAWGTAIVFTAAYLLAGRWLLQLFMDADSSQLALKTGMNFLRIVSPFYAVICIKIVADGILRGSGSMGCFMTATLADLVLRVLLAWILRNFYGATGIWLAWPLSWTIGTILSYCFYRSNVWCKHLKMEE
ncbi:MAG: MATE family efflux transporter [Oscillospiraceae bacterium]|nr:MATE family efflux transporter [Oscillospiraceae bacterium]